MGGGRDFFRRHFGTSADFLQTGDDHAFTGFESGLDDPVALLGLADLDITLHHLVLGIDDQHASATPWSAGDRGLWHQQTILAFTLNTCAYSLEIFAGAIRDLAHGEVEAARAYGFSGWRLYRHIILPAALRRALPAYSNEVILMLHATSLAFTATVPDILKVARDANAATYQPFYSFGLAALIYLLISFGLVALFRLAEQRWLVHLKPITHH